MVTLPNLDAETGRELGIVEMLHRQAARDPLRTFIHTPAATLSYGDVLDRSARLAGAFARRGVGEGTSVAVLMDNSVEQVIVWFALARLGALHAPVNTALVGERLRHVLAVAGCRIAVVDAALLARLRDVQDHLAGLDTVVVNDAGESAGLPAATPPLSELMAHGRPVEPAAPDPLEPATLLFTSGTTGVSKACVLSHRYLAVQGAAHARNFQLRADDVLYCPFPLFHIDAATLTVVAALSVGGTAALSRRFSASRFWAEVRACGATVFNFMGATLSILWKQPPSTRDRAHGVRLAWGIPMPEWKERWEDRFGFPLYQVYGSTDAGVPVYDPLDGTQRAGACGRITDLFEVRIDPGPLDGDEPDPGPRAGEILVRGRHPGLTMSGYYGMPEATAKTIDPDGWVHTGDLGSLDEDGFLTFEGRLSDSIRRRGENIFAFEVEELVTAHPAIVEAAAIGVPSELTEEDVKVCVVRAPGAELDPASLHEYCVQRAPKHMVPRYYEFLAELPKTPTEKVEKFHLKAAGITGSTWDAESR